MRFRYSPFTSSGTRLTPRARIHHLSVRGDDPIFMLSAPIPAIIERL